MKNIGKKDGMKSTVKGGKTRILMGGGNMRIKNWKTLKEGDLVILENHITKRKYDVEVFKVNDDSLIVFGTRDDLDYEASFLFTDRDLEITNVYMKQVIVNGGCLNE